MSSGDMTDAGMGCMGMDVMAGLVRPAGEEEVVDLGWEGVGAAGAEKEEVDIPCGGVSACTHH